jgi:hypothetical protein
MHIAAMAKAISRRRVGLVGILLVFAGSATLAILSGDSLRYEDETEYNQLAQSLVHEHAFAQDTGRLTVFRPPGYAFALAAVYEIVERPLAAKILNCLALAATSLLAMTLSRRIFPAGAALAPYLILFYPVFLYAATTLYPQTIGGLLLLTTLLLLSKAQRGLRHVVAAGVIYACLCLTIPAFLYITPFLLGSLLFERRRPTKSAVANALVLAASIVLTIAPWTIRNEIQFGTLIPISTNGGINLLVGNSAIARANGKPTIAALGVECPPLLNPPDEVELNREVTQCAITWITANPTAAARLYFAKLLNYFNFRSELATSTERKRWQDWLAFATYYPLLIVALLRLALARRYRMSSLEALLYAIYFGNAVLTAVFFTNLRFRIPFDLLLVTIDAAWLARLFCNDKPNRALTPFAMS